ncbi:hypothetical protein BaRGS_00021786, partial [Batillaria attramentaria]
DRSSVSLPCQSLLRFPLEDNDLTDLTEIDRDVPSTDSPPSLDEVRHGPTCKGLPLIPQGLTLCPLPPRPLGQGWLARAVRQGPVSSVHDDSKRPQILDDQQLQGKAKRQEAANTEAIFHR